ncbi:hypothetical protein ACFFX1_55350 [Dactylosporangium sucinum]|uniref:Uncharacterized protein n=1 Tax=Dactylosporangium sucinum TaxID=1424081 RepID=A0A917U2J5_9ACTN|nr:hypothetical protein [Dactylosporangium sucinum]GGM52794.1 hypothetical protein GCM10007977_062940 [Dactylosporangium sucinum]
MTTDLGAADPNDTYCVCPDCLRCGCGVWERHHTNLGDITPVTNPKETR